MSVNFNTSLKLVKMMMYTNDQVPELYTCFLCWLCDLVCVPLHVKGCVFNTTYRHLKPLKSGSSAGGGGCIKFTLNYIIEGGEGWL